MTAARFADDTIDAVVSYKAGIAVVSAAAGSASTGKIASDTLMILLCWLQPQAIDTRKLTRT